MNIKRAVLLGLSLTGAIVGVGFASGKEIWTFFAQYGYWSILFCVLAGCLFGALAFLIFIISDYHREVDQANICRRIKKRIIKKRKIAKYLLKNNTQKRKIIKNNATDIMFSVLLFVCQISICSAMFAGLGTVMLYLGAGGVSVLITKVAMLIFCFLYLSLSKSGVYIVNTFLSAVIMILIFVLFIASVGKYSVVVFDSTTKTGLIYMPLLFVGMNIFTTFPLLTELSNSIKAKKQKLLTAIFFGVFVTIVLTLVCVSELIFSKGTASDMPMLSLAVNSGKIMGIIYAIVIIASIISTCLSTGYGASVTLRLKIKYGLKLSFCLLLSFALSFVGFSGIVDYVYPALGLLCLVFIVVKFLSKRG